MDIDRVSAENPELVEFELIGKLDLTNLRLPGRQVVEHCPWIYKGSECGYKPGKMFNLKNQQVTNAADDQCAKNLKACELRFPKGQGIGPKDELLPFGGFPGADFRSDAEQHAARCAPNEACGVVVDGKYWPCRNTLTTRVLIL